MKLDFLLYHQVEVVALSSYEEKEELFKEQVRCLMQALPIILINEFNLQFIWSSRFDLLLYLSLGWHAYRVKVLNIVGWIHPAFFMK